MRSSDKVLSELGQRTGPPPISWLMHLTLSRPGLISLAAGFTDSASLPVDEVRSLLDEVLGRRRSGQAALQYGSTQGDPILRRLTADYLRDLDGAEGPAFSPERMIIVNGSQQLLYLATEALCDPGDIVLVEDPTYFVYLGILQGRGVRTRTVRLTSDGLDLGHLERVLESLKRQGKLRRLKLLYLVSYFQNPTGITTRFDRKAALLRLLRRYEKAAGHAIYVLEDAAYRELRFEGRDEPSSLAAKGARERVIYAGTYSKPFATGVRVGFGLLPEPVFTTVLRIKGNHDFGSSNLLQQLMARALGSGRYGRHLQRIRKAYGRKAAVMARGLKEHLPADAEWQRPAGGLYYWVRLPDRLKAGTQSRLFRTALAKEVLYVPGELCYAEDSTRRKPLHEMRLSFGSASERDITEGVRRLGAAVRETAG